MTLQPFGSLNTDAVRRPIEKASRYHGEKMEIYKKILVPIDGAVFSDAVFSQALSYAKIVHGDITVIHILENNIHLHPPFDNIKVTPAISLVGTELSVIVESMLSDYIEKGKEENVKIDSLIVKGNVAKDIIQKSSNYDLIIMGSLEESSLKSLFLGSNAEKVARHASCSVMLVKE